MPFERRLSAWPVRLRGLVDRDAIDREHDAPGPWPGTDGVRRPRRLQRMQQPHPTRPTVSHLTQVSLDMLVLQAVAAGPAHGFGVMQRLRQLSGEAFQVPPRALYPTLHRLESAGLLVAARTLSDGRSAKIYRVTAAGRRRLGDDTGWKLLSDAVCQIAKLQHEMETAAAIQRALLPNSHRAGSFFDAAATTIPCRSIGGDFFEYMDLPGGALGFALGDVAGKGPPAALLAALMQGSLAAQAHASDGPAATMAAVNAAIVRRGIQGRFVTLFYGVLFPDGRVTYCNAGHNPPILASASSGVRRLETGGTVLGLFDGVPYDEGSVTLLPDDYLVLFSDGISEAMNDAGEEFGDDRLVGCLDGVTKGEADSRLHRIFASVKQFTAAAPQHDDVTAMVVSYRPPAA